MVLVVVVVLVVVIRDFRALGVYGLRGFGAV